MANLKDRIDAQNLCNKITHTVYHDALMRRTLSQFLGKKVRKIGGYTKVFHESLTEVLRQVESQTNEKLPGTVQLWLSSRFDRWIETEVKICWPETSGCFYVSDTVVMGVIDSSGIMTATDYDKPYELKQYTLQTVENTIQLIEEKENQLRQLKSSIYPFIR